MFEDWKKQVQEHKLLYFLIAFNCFGLGIVFTIFVNINHDDSIRGQMFLCLADNTTYYTNVDCTCVRNVDCTCVRNIFLNQDKTIHPANTSEYFKCTILNAVE